MANLAQTARKVVYLADQYPEKTLTEIIALLALPAIDINTSIWYAQEQGWLTEPDGETGAIQVPKKPAVWNFGPEEAQLEDMILFAFKNLNSKEQDLEEFYISQWTAGYPSHDVLIAMRRLLEKKKLHEYQLEDGAEKYIFYTLFENADKLWGRKQFKKDPLTNVKKNK